jgi:hypothetical protein
MSALDRERAKTQDNQLFYESASDSDSNSDKWRGQRWKAARQAHTDGAHHGSPQRRVAVLLAPGGPVRTAAQVQQLAGLAAPPATMETSLVAVGEGTQKTTEIGRVVVCDVSEEEGEKMGEKVEFFEMFSPSGMDRTVVLFEGMKQYARVVKRLEDGVTLVGDGGASENGTVN